MTSTTRSIAVRPAAFFTAVLLAAGLAAPISAQQGVLRDGAILDSIETPHGTIYKVHRARPQKAASGPILPSFSGDSYSFEHQLGALIDQILKCFDLHHAGMDDNTALFDGLSELLDPYVDGTQPLIFEFETAGLEGAGGQRNAFFNSFAGGDLFPEGFEDPDTGTPLDAACIEIGIDDTLDSDSPAEISSAMIEMSNTTGPVLPPTDITSFFSNPFDGKLSIGFSGLAGQDIDGMVLEMTLESFEPQPIFADGFESGDASAWTDSAP